MNAIILAAGMGTRLLPLTCTTPKPLTVINGITIIERQINFLIEAGIKEINIVVGYKAGLFQFLKKKYNINLILNPKFDEYNNIYSLSLCLEMLRNTWIIEGDVFLKNNFIDASVKQSTYFPIFKSHLLSEWILEFLNESKLRRILTPTDPVFHTKYKRGAYVMSGISFWDQSSSDIIKSALITFLQITQKEENSSLKGCYWDQIIKDNLDRLDILVTKLNNDDCFEVDNNNDLSMLLNNINS